MNDFVCRPRARTAQPNQHQADGLFGRAAAGPAMPVTDTTTSARALAIAPAAMAAGDSVAYRAVRRDECCRHAEQFGFCFIGICNEAAITTSDEPTISVRMAVIRPPVQLSAVATRQPRARNRSIRRAARWISSTGIIRVPREGRKYFFFEKKETKNFCLLVDATDTTGTCLNV